MKKILSVFIVLVLVFGVTTNLMAADLNSSLYTGALSHDEYLSRCYPSSENITKEQITFRAEKEAFFESLDDSTFGAASDTSKAAT